MPVAADDLIKLLLALVLGGLIGWERELYDKPAGFRTNTLICVGSTLFTIFSLKIGTIPGTDSARIAAQIVSGIGFLGAGAIIRRGEAVLGLTTAATIWFVASIGMGVGAGYYLTSSIGTALALAILLLFRKFENVVDRFHTTRTYHVILSADNDAVRELSLALDSCELRVLGNKQVKSDNRYVYEITLTGRKANHNPLLEKLLKSPTVIEVRY
ncbi:MAG TPA: MgtC/SapB family protein [Candidatus Binatia bacterium]|jgi:putative Mg2+ transporter-C (MgtC) family protein|nr:MgtC/SapB family protein [Candidatus Binatia bacterium]